MVKLSFPVCIVSVRIEFPSRRVKLSAMFSLARNHATLEISLCLYARRKYAASFIRRSSLRRLDAVIVPKILLESVNISRGAVKDNWCSNTFRMMP